MKLASLVSNLRPAAALLVLLPLLLIGWAPQLAANPIGGRLSSPLQNRDTYTAVQEVAEHAQRMSMDSDDTNMRLTPKMPKVIPEQEYWNMCCLHVHILDFYLHNILPHHDGHAKVQRLQSDLGRVSADLQTHGCNVTLYHGHQHTVEFHRKLKTLEEKQRLNKAVGEIDILFSALQDFCVVPSNSSAAAAAAGEH